MAATVPKQQTGVARLNTGNMLRIETVSDLKELAKLLYDGGASSMPNIDRPEKVARIILAGAEVGLSPAQSLESIWIGKTGKTSIWGDGAIALVRASGLIAEGTFKEWVDGEGDNRTGHCQAKRVGGELMEKTFTIREANKAGLIERARGQKGDGPWITYQDRMLTQRARGFLLRDLFPDVLKGLITTEELQDQASESVEVRVVSSTVNPAPQLPASQPASATTVQQQPVGPPPITPDQKKEIAAIRGTFLTAKGLATATQDEQRAAWGEVLAAYSVKSAAEFTEAQAAEFIAREGPKHGDPFGHPKSLESSGTAAGGVMTGTGTTITMSTPVAPATTT